MKGLIILADYFEETEALASIDVLIRAGEKITRVSMMQDKFVKAKGGFEIVCDCVFQDIKPLEYDYLIIPGGKASFTILNVDPRVEKLIDDFIANNKLVASICAAPHLLGRKGYFKNRDYTVHPGFETYFTAGTYLKDQGVVRDDKFVTAKSMYYSLDFAFEILTFLYGEEFSNKIKLSCKGEE